MGSGLAKRSSELLSKKLQTQQQATGESTSTKYGHGTMRVIENESEEDKSETRAIIDEIAKETIKTVTSDLEEEFRKGTSRKVTFA